MGNQKARKQRLASCTMVLKTRAIPRAAETRNWRNSSASAGRIGGAKRAAPRQAPQHPGQAPPSSGHGRGQAAAAAAQQRVAAAAVDETDTPYRGYWCSSMEQIAALDLQNQTAAEQQHGEDAIPAPLRQPSWAPAQSWPTRRNRLSGSGPARRGRSRRTDRTATRPGHYPPPAVTSSFWRRARPMAMPPRRRA